MTSNPVFNLKNDLAFELPKGTILEVELVQELRGEVRQRERQRQRQRQTETETETDREDIQLNKTLYRVLDRDKSMLYILLM